MLADHYTIAGMTENATPKPARRPRPVRYPKQLITLVSLDAHEEIERTAAERDVTKTDVVRPRLELGKILEAAYAEGGIERDLRFEVQDLARRGSVSEAGTIAYLLREGLRAFAP